MSLVKIQGNASGTGEFTIAAPNSNTNRTLTLPDNTGTLNTSGAANEVPAGSASTPSIYPTGDTNTGIFFPAADTIAFTEGGTESIRINSSGNVGIGTTSPAYQLDINNASSYSTIGLRQGGTLYGFIEGGSSQVKIGTNTAIPALFEINGTERARITSGGDLLIGQSSTSAPGASGNNAEGAAIKGLGNLHVSVNSSSSSFNRKGDDGTLLAFNQDGTTEGSITVSGTTVSYNGGNLSRWAQMLGAKDNTLVKGTVMSNLDEMNVYTDAEGNPVENEQLNKVKVSDVEGDVNVAGVFVNWDYDEAHQVDEINMAMTGDMIIRIAQGVVVQKGDLLMSAGDGTAKPQGDDIVRSKTVAKVTSNHVTCTYEDGSYCVPCVLMAC